MAKPLLIQSVTLICSLILLSCGAKHSKGRDYGKMTVADLLKEKGTPIKEESIPVKNGKILKYENEENFQVKGDVVMNSFRQPKTEESTLLYWKNAFKECETEEKILKPAGHEAAEMELACKSLGKSVLYTEGSELVTRVIEYAPQ